ncbi:MAG: 30S ribosomal protein S2 [Anaerolineales bacterium]|nr:30S ribosomal protein S2 [Anaerolineales bacterium]
MAIVTMKALLETGVHFGHRTRKWNPRMKSYIFTERNGIHIIDLQQTLEALDTAYDLVRDTIAAGGRVLFVGTKRQAQETIELEAKRCMMPYVNARWLGGTLTNWRTIRSQIDELEGLERRRDAGMFELLTKKEALSLTRRIDKLEERLGGIREMVAVPDLLFVVDVRREETSIHEANLLGIPVIALVDTNCDPRNIDYVIPSNDDAIRAVKLMTSKIADAVLEGKALRKDVEEEEAAELSPTDLEAMAEIERTDEELLGEATLAKLQSGAFDEQLVKEPDQPAPEELEAEVEIKEEAEEEAQLPDEAEEEAQLPDEAEEENQLPDEAEEENQGETQDSSDSGVSEVEEDAKEDGE